MSVLKMSKNSKHESAKQQLIQARQNAAYELLLQAVYRAQ